MLQKRIQVSQNKFGFCEPLIGLSRYLSNSTFSKKKKDSKRRYEQKNKIRGYILILNEFGGFLVKNTSNFVYFAKSFK